MDGALPIDICVVLYFAAIPYLPRADSIQPWFLHGWHNDRMPVRKRKHRNKRLLAKHIFKDDK